VCTAPAGYLSPPQGCPWEMLNCGEFGAFNKTACDCWFGETIWNEVNICTCLDGWIGSDCSIVESQDQCSDDSVYDGTFLLDSSNVTYKHVECYLDDGHQDYLDLEDHRVNITLTPSISEPAASFNISVVVYSRIHHHEQQPPNQWAPVIPAIWCSAAWCSTISYPQNDSTSFVMYECPYVSCGACTPQNGDCNVYLDEVMSWINASETHPLEIIFQDALIGSGSFILKTNIVQLTGSCIVGQCNPWAPAERQD